MSNSNSLNHVVKNSPRSKNKRKRSTNKQTTSASTSNIVSEDDSCSNNVDNELVDTRKEGDYLNAFKLINTKSSNDLEFIFHFILQLWFLIKKKYFFATYILIKDTTDHRKNTISDICLILETLDNNEIIKPVESNLYNIINELKTKNTDIRKSVLLLMSNKDNQIKCHAVPHIHAILNKIKSDLVSNKISVSNEDEDEKNITNYLDQIKDKPITKILRLIKSEYNYTNYQMEIIIILLLHYLKDKKTNPNNNTDNVQYLNDYNKLIDYISHNTSFDIKKYLNSKVNQLNKLKLMILGAGGTGKNFLIKLVYMLIDKKYSNVNWISVAYQNKHAKLLSNGLTIHKVLGISACAKEYDVAACTQKLKKNLKNIKTVVIDEISAIPVRLYKLFHECMNNQFSIIILGDFFQLNPVANKINLSKYLNVSENNNFSHVNLIYHLDHNNCKNHRFLDDETKTVMSELRKSDKCDSIELQNILSNSYKVHSVVEIFKYYTNIDTISTPTSFAFITYKNYHCSYINTILSKYLCDLYQPYLTKLNVENNYEVEEIEGTVSKNKEKKKKKIYLRKYIPLKNNITQDVIYFNHKNDKEKYTFIDNENKQQTLTKKQLLNNYDHIFAITIHKVLGKTITYGYFYINNFYDFPQNEVQSLLYVSFSRIRKIKNLYLLFHINSNTILDTINASLNQYYLKLNTKTLEKQISIKKKWFNNLKNNQFLDNFLKDDSCINIKINHINNINFDINNYKILQCIVIYSLIQLYKYSLQDNTGHYDFLSKHNYNFYISTNKDFDGINLNENEIKDLLPLFPNCDINNMNEYYKNNKIYFYMVYFNNIPILPYQNELKLIKKEKIEQMQLNKHIIQQFKLEKHKQVIEAIFKFVKDKEKNIKTFFDTELKKTKISSNYNTTLSKKNKGVYVSPLFEMEFDDNTKEFVPKNQCNRIGMTNNFSSRSKYRYNEAKKNINTVTTHNVMVLLNLDEINKLFKFISNNDEFQNLLKEIDTAKFSGLSGFESIDEFYLQKNSYDKYEDENFINFVQLILAEYICAFTFKCVNNTFLEQFIKLELFCKDTKLEIETKIKSGDLHQSIFFNYEIIHIRKILKEEPILLILTWQTLKSKFINEVRQVEKDFLFYEQEKFGNLHFLTTQLLKLIFTTEKIIGYFDVAGVSPSYQSFKELKNAITGYHNDRTDDNLNKLKTLVDKFDSYIPPDYDQYEKVYNFEEIVKNERGPKLQNEYKLLYIENYNIKQLIRNRKLQIVDNIKKNNEDNITVWYKFYSDNFENYIYYDKDNDKVILSSCSFFKIYDLHGKITNKRRKQSILNLFAFLQMLERFEIIEKKNLSLSTSITLLLSNINSKLNKPVDTLHEQVDNSIYSIVRNTFRRDQFSSIKQKTLYTDFNEGTNKLNELTFAYLSLHLTTEQMHTFCNDIISVKDHINKLNQIILTFNLKKNSNEEFRISYNCRPLPAIQKKM